MQETFWLQTGGGLILGVLLYTEEPVGPSEFHSKQEGHENLAESDRRVQGPRISFQSPPATPAYRLRNALSYLVCNYETRGFGLGETIFS